MNLNNNEHSPLKPWPLSFVSNSSNNDIGKNDELQNEILILTKALELRDTAE